MESNSGAPQGGSSAKKKNSNLFLKILFIGLVALLCFIASLLVRAVVNDRIQNADQARAFIADKWGQEQMIASPFLLTVQDGNPLTIHPMDVSVDVDLQPQKRSRGIWETVIYDAKVTMTGSFASTSAVAGRAQYFLIPVADKWSIQDLELASSFMWNDREVGLKDMNTTLPEIEGYYLNMGFIGQPVTWQTGENEFSIQFETRGNAVFAFESFAQQARVHMTSPWSNPSFNGVDLPVERVIQNGAFEADWVLNNRAALEGTNFIHHTNAVRAVQECYECASRFEEASLQVSLLSGVDVYTEVDRATKYAILFILLTFIAFFMFEVMRHIRVHPIQYLLVGMALAIFYLLLLALSEHIGFLTSYILAAISVVGIIGLYVKHIVKSHKRVSLIVAMLTGLYAFLYVLLQLQDAALLVGTIFLFIVLASIMYFTRKVDWYQISSTD